VSDVNTGTSTPGWVRAVLLWPALVLIARLALLSAYVFGGLTKLLHFSDAVAEQAHFGLRPAALWATFAIIVEIGAPILILCRRWVWLATGALGVLTFIAMIVADKFWAVPASERTMAINGFLEHLGLIGGFILIASTQEGQRLPRR
jgi:uncharacterized membrane protein YphA (DoxX/SURF4 family)